MHSCSGLKVSGKRCIASLNGTEENVSSGLPDLDVHMHWLLARTQVQSEPMNSESGAERERWRKRKASAGYPSTTQYFKDKVQIVQFNKSGTCSHYYMLFVI